MQAILVTSRTADKAKIFSKNARDNCNNKFILLRRELAQKGIRLGIEGNGKANDADIYIMIDIQPEKFSIQR